MALRLLHTADWHLGHALYGVDRAYEHERALAWLLDAIVHEDVDVVVVAGDVFDAANPPTQALETWARFLTGAWERVPHLQISVVGGNHDSPARLEVNDPFLRAMKRLNVIGGVSRRDAEPDLDRLLVPLYDRGGRTVAWLAAVPFLRASETGAGTDDAVSEGTRRFYGGVFERARALRQPGQAMVAAGHLYLAGGRGSELSERKLVVGNQSAVPVDVFPADLAYVALGHLHLAQAVGGRETVRYSGSLLPLSLAERAYPHQVVLVDLEGEAALCVRSLRVPRFVEILRVPERGAAALDDVLAAIAALPVRGDGPHVERPYLEVEVAVDRPEPALRQRIEAALEGKEPRLVRLGVAMAGSGLALGDVEARPIADLAPEEVFRRKYEREYGGAPPPEILHAFLELERALLKEEAA